MSKQNLLFYNEEQVLQNTDEVLEQFKNQDTPLYKPYARLGKEYKKLLNQSALLVKMSDRQQRQLTRLAETLETKNSELVILNQEKNEFLGIAAHDLKNPLNAIQAAADFILDDFEDFSKEETIDLLTMISQASRQMFYLVNNLLDVNRIESGKINISLNETDLLPLVQTLVSHHERSAAAKKLSLHLQTTDQQSYPALIDENLFIQVLDNLISNAIKYSPPSKNIHIRLIRGERIRCEVRDEGPGLSESDQKKLFGKFTQLSAKPTGGEHSTGLGLFIVKKLVTAMNGSVWCESVAGEGAMFGISFPVATGLPNDEL
ncbi:MAG: HAMP domain-containing histidine kinase [Gammaproteobacteria bacterium]|nr:HAMP domain-containing histidine kinase [Gammaproteobacteria bacterium]